MVCVWDKHSAFFTILPSLKVAADFIGGNPFTGLIETTTEKITEIREGFLGIGYTEREWNPPLFS